MFNCHQKNYEIKKWDTLIKALTDLAPVKKKGGGTSKIERQQIVENEIKIA